MAKTRANAISAAVRRAFSDLIAASPELHRRFHGV
jgi:hypothetical protein